MSISTSPTQCHSYDQTTGGSKGIHSSCIYVFLARICRFVKIKKCTNIYKCLICVLQEYQRTVQEQVATLKNSGASKACEPSALNSAAGQWSAALLDASATVQVKAAQLEQVKQYHKQMKLTRAFLEVIAAEKEKTSL